MPIVHALMPLLLATATPAAPREDCLPPPAAFRAALAARMLPAAKRPCLPPPE